MPFSGLTALDLTDRKGYVCGQILGDLGVDVIKVEPPGGDPGRQIGPFYHDTKDPERNLYWFAFNRSKRGITLDIRVKDGQELFRELVKRSDFILESFTPGYLDKLGLGFSALREINPRLIMTSITPFGQTGPYRNYKGYNLTIMGMSGFSYLAGDPDRPPLSLPAENSFILASVCAAGGTLTAYWNTISTGRGEHVDVSILEAMVRGPALELWYWLLQKHIIKRNGMFRYRGNILQRATWRCKDGFVHYAFWGGAFGARQVCELVKWMEDEGVKTSLKKKSQNWADINLSTVSQDEVQSWEKEFGDFIRDKTKEHIYEEAIKRGLFIAPMNNIKDIAQDKHLQSREFWLKLFHHELGEDITYPGGFYKSNQVMPNPRFCAPLIGEYNKQIYCEELGLLAEYLAKLKEEGTV